MKQIQSLFLFFALMVAFASSAQASRGTHCTSSVGQVERSEKQQLQDKLTEVQAKINEQSDLDPMEQDQDVMMQLLQEEKTLKTKLYELEIKQLTQGQRAEKVKDLEMTLRARIAEIDALNEIPVRLRTKDERIRIKEIQRDHKEMRAQIAQIENLASEISDTLKTSLETEAPPRAYYGNEAVASSSFVANAADIKTKSPDAKKEVSEAPSAPAKNVESETKKPKKDNIFISTIKQSFFLGTFGGVRVRGVKTVGQAMVGTVIPIPLKLPSKLGKVTVALFGTYGGIFGQNGLNHQLTQNGVTFLAPFKGWLVGPAVAYSRVLVINGKDFEHLAALVHAVNLKKGLFGEVGYAASLTRGVPGLVQFRVGVIAPNAKVKKGIGKIFGKLFGR